ncbi:MAG: indole-3-glycerol-phosphate synthase TrpC, partial [Actinomyces sp.]
MPPVRTLNPRTRGLPYERADASPRVGERSAEVKRATATFADLSGVGDVAVLARFYEAGGAACVSVVTEPVR